MARRLPSRLAQRLGRGATVILLEHRPCKVLGGPAREPCRFGILHPSLISRLKVEHLPVGGGRAHLHAAGLHLMEGQVGPMIPGGPPHSRTMCSPPATSK